MYLPKFRYILWSKYFVVSWLGETIDTDQSVALMVAKVTIDTDRLEVRSGYVYWHLQWLCEFVWLSGLTHVKSYSVLLFCMVVLYVIVLIMEEEKKWLEDS